MSTSKCTLSSSTSSIYNPMESITRERDENDYFKTMARPLFNSTLCNFTCVVSLQVPVSHKKDYGRYMQFQPHVFTVCFPFHLDSFDSQTQKTKNAGICEKLVTTSSMSESTYAPQRSYEQTMPLQPLAESRRNQVDPWNPYNRCILQPSHKLTLHRNRKSKTFCIETHKRLTQLRRRYKKYLVTKKFVHYIAHEYTYYTEIDSGNVAVKKSYVCVHQCQKYASFDSQYSMESGRYKIPNYKYITPGKGNRDLTVLYVASGTKNMSFQSSEHTSAGYLPTDCDPYVCLQKVKKYTAYGNNASTQSNKYKIHEQGTSSRTPSDGNLQPTKSKQKGTKHKKEKVKQLQPYECMPDTCVPKKQKYEKLKPYECEPGICVPRHLGDSVPRKLNGTQWATKKKLPKQFDLDTTALNDGSKKGKSSLPSECPPTSDLSECFQPVQNCTPCGYNTATQSYKLYKGKLFLPCECAPTTCDLNEYLQQVQKSTPYGYNTPTQADKYMIPNEKQRDVKKSTARRGRESAAAASSKIKLNSTQPVQHSSDVNGVQQVKKYRPYGFHAGTQSSKEIVNEKQGTVKKASAKRGLDTAVPDVAARKRRATQPGDGVSTDCDPNECLQQIKKNTPYGRHASTQSSKYKMKNLKRETVNKSSAKRGMDNIILDVIPKNKSRAMQFGVGISINCDPNKCLQQLKKYGNNASTQSVKYKIQELSSRELRGPNLGPTKSKQKGTKGRKENLKKRKPFQCEPSTCVPHQPVDSVPRKTNKTQRVQQTLKRMYCKPNDCDTSQCETNPCYQRLQPTRSDIINAYNTSHSSVTSTQTRQNRMPNYNTTQQQKQQHRQAVRIGSTWSFDVVFYKSITKNGTVVQQLLVDKNPVPTSFHKTQSDKKEFSRMKLNPYECKPGIYAPAIRDHNPRRVGMPGICNNLTKSFHLSTSNTSSNATSRRSLAKERKLNRRNINLNNDKGIFGMPKHRKNTPYRQAVRIRSNCRSNVKYYIGMPQNVQNVFTTNVTAISQNEQVINAFKINANQCKCNPVAYVQESLKPLDYEHEICVPGNCDPSIRFQGMKVTGAEGSHTSISKMQSRNEIKEENVLPSKDQGLSCTPSPRIPLHLPNMQVVCTGNGNASSSKFSLNFECYESLPQNGVKDGVHNHKPTKNDHRVTSIRFMTRNIKRIHECKRDVCNPAKCCPGTCDEQAVEQFDREPGVCIPSKRDPNKCLQQTKVTVLDTDINTSSCNQASMFTILMNKYRLLKDENVIIYKDKDQFTVPKPNMIFQIFNTRVVNIGSKCSCNVEFYKGLPQNGFGMSDPFYAPPSPEQFKSSVRRDIKQGEKTSSRKTKQANPFDCKPGICVPGKCDPSACIQNAISRFDCERGVCVPGKCEPSKCFERIKVSGTDTESVGSQASKSMKKGRLLKEKNSVHYKNKGSSSMPRPKMLLHIANREAVRIGSKCSFNVEFYKSYLQNGFTTNENVSQPTNYHSNAPAKQKTSSSRKKRKEKNPFECEPGICKPGKCDPATCAQQALKRFDCDPGVCVPGKCDPHKCFQRIKATAANTDSNTTSHGSQASMSKNRLKKGQLQNDENVIVYKDKAVGSTTRSNVPSSHAVRIGSTLSFNVEFYKSLPSNGIVPNELSNEFTNYDQRDPSTQNKASSSMKKKALKPYECQPGVCTPRKCDPRECLQRLKFSGTDSDVTSRGSQVSSKKLSKRKRGKEYRYKDASVSSKQRPEKPPPKPIHVRVESGFNFNTEVFKTLPPKGVVTSEQSNKPTKHDHGDSPTRQKASGRKKKRVVKPFECQPGVCIPRKCDPYKCVQRLKPSGTDTNPSLKTDSNVTSLGSLASSKAHKPKHAVRIGSTLSFNVELYKTLPPKGIANTNAQHDQGDSPIRTDRGKHGYECQPGVCIPGKCDVAKCFQLLNPSSTDSSRSGKKKLKPYECEPGICVPGKCDPRACLQRGLPGIECQPGVCIPGKCDVVKCFQRLRISGTETTDSNATSRGSQAYAKTSRQKKGSKRNQGHGFRSKSKCVCMREPKKRIPRKHMVQIGSKCSFNLEFYKTLPQNNFVRNLDQGDTLSSKKGQVLNSYECKPGICVPGKCDPVVCAKHGLTGFECQPGICIPGKCDATKCFQQLNRSSTDSSLECEPGVCVPGKCDPKLCLQHALNGFECLPGVCIPGKCDVAKCIQQLKSNSTGTSKKKKSKKFECDPGICIPGKCDPYECLARLKILHGASAYSEDGQAFTQTMKGKKVSRKNIAGKETLYKEKGASTKPRNKMPLHMPDRDVVRIGSKCSFNIEFYKEKPNGLKMLSQMECEPGVCIPKKCDPIECYRRLQNIDKNLKRDVGGTKRNIFGTKRKVKGTKHEVVSMSGDEETKSESEASKRGGKKVIRGTDKTKLKAKKSKSGDEEVSKSESEGSKRKVKKPKRKTKKTKRKAKKPKRESKEAGAPQSVDDDSKEEDSSPTEYEQSGPKRKGIMSLIKKCCKCKRKQKTKSKPKPKPKRKAEPEPEPEAEPEAEPEEEPEPDAESYDSKNDSQESVTRRSKPKLAKPKKPSKQKIKREPKSEQSFEREDFEEDVADTSPRVESPTKTYGTSAGTQSRKYPAREMMPRIKPPVKRNICDCGAKILPPLTDRIYAFIVRMLRARGQLYKTEEDDYDIFVIEPNDCCSCPEEVNNYCSEEVEERGVVIGSSGFFNLKLTKNDTRTTKK